MTRALFPNDENIEPIVIYTGEGLAPNFNTSHWKKTFSHWKWNAVFRHGQFAKGETIFIQDK